METGQEMSHPSQTSFNLWGDFKLVVGKYGRFLLQKCIRKNDFSYLKYIAKMELAYLISRFGTPEMCHALFPELAKLKNTSERIRILLLTYLFFRIDDDIADGEFSEGTPKERAVYILNRTIRARQGALDKHITVDQITAEVLQLAKQVGIEEDLRKCLLLIFESLSFDAQRVQDFHESGERKLISKDILVDNYFRLDTLGTGQAMLLIFGEKPEKLSPGVTELCANFSDAVRISYSLRDFVEDIRTGIVNIPKEDAEKFGITMTDIDTLAGHGKISSASDSIKAWMKSEIQAAKELFKKGSDAFTNPELSELSRETMRGNYVEDFWRDIHRVEEKLVGAIVPIAPTKNLVAALIDGNAMIQALMYQYADALKLNPDDAKKFMRKSRNLFVMYLGFSKNKTYQAIDGAALSGFLSAYYDWVTDGPHAGAETQEIFLKVLESASQNKQANVLVQDMLQKDISKTLADDGLERGAISFIFILEMMGLRAEYEGKCDIREVGNMLQVIDDIDDLEDDTAKGDWNALNTPKASEYLKRLETCFPDSGASIFSGKLLVLFIEKARKKAKKFQIEISK